MTTQVSTSSPSTFWQNIINDSRLMEQNYNVFLRLSILTKGFEEHAIKYRETAERVSYGDGGNPGPQGSINNAVKVINDLCDELKLNAEGRSRINILNPSDAGLTPAEIESKIYDLHRLLNAFADRFDESAVALRETTAKQQDLVEQRNLTEALAIAKVALEKFE